MDQHTLEVLGSLELTDWVCGALQGHESPGAAYPQSGGRRSEVTAITTTVGTALVGHGR